VLLATTSAYAQTALSSADALIRAGKFAEAKKQLESYLTSHPGNAGAEALLGVANENLDDAPNAAAAFDVAGTIPDQYKVVAAKAYAEAAVEKLKANDNETAIVLANKAIALQSNVNVLYIRAAAYANAQKYGQAITDLENAKTQATAGHADADTLNAIDTSLTISYLFGGEAAKGLALAQVLKKRDPSNTRVDDALASYYNQQAAAVLQAGKIDEAVADLEIAAREVPSRAALLYVQAANVLAQGSQPDWKRVQTEAEKALVVAANDARANYVVGIALGNQGNRSAAVQYLQKAKANAGSDTSLSNDIDGALKKLGQQ
jgi:tetratricopeptide (TPR) repeat protein